MSSITVTRAEYPLTVTETSSGFTVTTPENQTITISSPSTSVNVTPVTNTIQVLSSGQITYNVTANNTDQITEGSTNLYYTNARADARVSLGIAGINYPVDSVNGKTDTVVLTTTDISEGTNKYYTDTRADVRVALGIAGINYPVDSVNGKTDTVVLTTTDIAEGTNKYYTDARADARVSAGISALVASAPSTLDTLNELATALGNDPNFATTMTTALGNKLNTADFTSTANTWLATKSTTNLSEGTNLYYTDARARAAHSAGTGVTYNSSTGVISIGQSVATTDSPTFNSLTLNGGNLTNVRNYVFGAIRNSTTQSIGDIWALNSTGPVQPVRGISLDNSADTTKVPGYLARSYSNTAGFRPRVVFERARFSGTVATPTAVQASDILGSIDATGYTSTGWINDNIVTGGAIPGTAQFTASENWVSNTNLGTFFNLLLAPTATTITSGTSLIPTIVSQPEGLILRGDRMVMAQGKTAAWAATGCSISGTTLTIGTLTSGTISVGNSVVSATNGTVNGLYIVANISGSGSGSTWTISGTPSGTLTGLALTGLTAFIGSVPATSNTTDILQDLRLVTNIIKSTGNVSFNNTTTQSTYGNSSNIVLTSGNPVAAAFNDRVSQFKVTTATTSGTEASTITFNTGLYDTGTKVYTPTQSGNTLGEFFFSGQYGTTSSFTTLGPSVRFQAKAAENFTSSNSGGQFVINLDKIGGNISYDAIQIDSTNAYLKSNTITLQDNNSNNYAILDSTKAQFNVPVKLPSYTATALRAITGQVGWMAAVSDSGGRLAYWDTTNSRWSFVFDNSAV